MNFLVLGAIILRNLTRDILESKVSAAYDINIENPSEISVFLKKTYFWFILRWAASDKRALT